MSTASRPLQDLCTWRRGGRRRRRRALPGWRQAHCTGGEAIDGRKIGVSVTRAFHFPPGTPCAEEDARHLLERKLSDIPLSAANAAPEDAWVRSALAVIAYDGQHADVVRTVREGLEADVRAETIVLVTVTDGEDAFVY